MCRHWRNYNFCPPPGKHSLHSLITVLIHNSGHFGPLYRFWPLGPRHCRDCRWLVTTVCRERFLKEITGLQICIWCFLQILTFIDERWEFKAYGNCYSRPVGLLPWNPSTAKFLLSVRCQSYIGDSALRLIHPRELNEAAVSVRQRRKNLAPYSTYCLGMSVLCDI